MRVPVFGICGVGTGIKVSTDALKMHRSLLTILPWPPSSNLLLKCCFTSTETVGLLGTGAQDGHLDFHTAPEL